MKIVKICYECKHCDSKLNECKRVSIKTPKLSECYKNLVTGHSTLKPEYVDKYIHRPACHIQRSYGWLTSRLYDTCGEEGRFFEQK